MTAAHPLAAVSVLAKAQGVLPHDLIVDHDGALVRMRTKSGLWVMRRTEDGSIQDRWSLDDGLIFVRLSEDQIAAGPDAILTHLLTLTEDAT